MGKKTEGRDHLCKIFDGLYDENKEKIVRLAEGLLNAQKVIKDRSSLLTGEMIGYSDRLVHIFRLMLCVNSAKIMQTLRSNCALKPAGQKQFNPAGI